jgi:hypothetical protein
LDQQDEAIKKSIKANLEVNDPRKKKVEYFPQAQGLITYWGRAGVGL